MKGEIWLETIILRLKMAKESKIPRLLSCAILSHKKYQSYVMGMKEKCNKICITFSYKCNKKCYALERFINSNFLEKP